MLAHAEGWHAGKGQVCEGAARPKGPKKSAAERFGHIDLGKGLPVWIAGQIG